MFALSSRRSARPAPRSTSTASPHCPCQERTVLYPQLVQAGSSGGTRRCDLIKASGVHGSHSSRNRNHMGARRWTLTFEFGVKRGDNMCGRPLCEVLPEELKPGVALFVPQLLVESPCGRRMTVSHPAKIRPRGLDERRTQVGEVVVDVSAKVGGYRTWMYGERLDTFGAQSPSEFYGEKDVGCLRLAIGTPPMVRLAVLIHRDYQFCTSDCPRIRKNSPGNLCRPSGCHSDDVRHC